MILGWSLNVGLVNPACNRVWTDYFKKMWNLNFFYVLCHVSHVHELNSTTANIHTRQRSGDLPKLSKNLVLGIPYKHRGHRDFVNGAQCDIPIIVAVCVALFADIKVAEKGVGVVPLKFDGRRNTWTIIGIHPIVIPKRYYLGGTCDLFKKSL